MLTAGAVTAARRTVGSKPRLLAAAAPVMLLALAAHAQ
jgi:hypothetical protein